MGCGVWGVGEWEEERDGGGWAEGGESGQRKEKFMLFYALVFPTIPTLRRLPPISLRFGVSSRDSYR